MGSMAPAARDIQATSGRDNFTDVAAQSVPVTGSHPFPLPTPPNSISPGLAPYGLRAQLLKAKAHPEGDVPDLDLHGAHISNQFDVASHVGLGSTPDDDPAGPLTAATLAKYHLPGILMNNDPLPIRAIRAQLLSSVPGFANIPETKARRLVVGALECRGVSGAMGGVNEDVVFEKVGWGTWGARRAGEPRREAPQSFTHSSLPSTSGIPITGVEWSNVRTRIGGASLNRDDSPVFSHDDRGFFMHEDQADRMSMDGSGSCSWVEGSEASEEMPLDDPEDETDVEDWEAIGAAGLRNESAGEPSTSGPGFRYSGLVKISKPTAIDSAAFAQGVPRPDAQEREAIEALLKLGGFA